MNTNAFSSLRRGPVLARRALHAMGAAMLVALPFTGRAADGAWTQQADGLWSDPANWLNGIVAEGSGASADLRQDYTSPVTITLDSPRTIGSISYGDNGNDPDVERLTITHPSHPLMLDTPSGSPDINVGQANVLILDVTLAGTQGLQLGKLTGRSGNASRIYLNKPATLAGGIIMTRGGLHLNAGNNTLPASSILLFNGSEEQWFALNGTSQEIAGLINAGGTENKQRIINDSTVDGLLILHVPAGTNCAFTGRVGYGGADSYPEQNNFGVVKKGAGTQTLNKQISAYTGPTTIEDGILDINNDGNSTADRGSLGSSEVGTTVKPGGTLRIRGTSATFLEPLTLAGSGFQGTNGALWFAGNGGGTGIGITCSGAITLDGHATLLTGTPTNTAVATCNGGFTDHGAGHGLTKTGIGTLILTSAALAGDSALSEGALLLGPDSWLKRLTVADAATLGVSNSVAVDSLMFTAGTAVLNIGYGDVAGVNPAGTAIRSVALVNQATVTVNVTGSGFTTTGGSPIVLLDYDTRSGAGRFVKGTLPPGLVGTLADNGSQVVLHITAAVNDLVWSGSVNGDWDLSTLNWNSGTAAYHQSGGIGDIVKFYDGASIYEVNLATAVAPAALTVNSSSLYTFTGPGKITGAVQLRKEGYGTLAIRNAHEYSGGTLILNGTVQLGHDAALGQGTLYVNEVAVPQPLSIIVLSSDGATPRTITNSVMMAAANLTPNVATLGDAVNHGALTLAGPVDFLPGVTHNVTVNSDVTFSGGVVSGGMNKLGPGTWTVTGAPAHFTRGFDVRDGTLVFSSVTATSTGDIRADAENSLLGFARIVITNEAVVAVGGNLRLGDDVSGTKFNNVCDVSATCIVPNGGIVMNRNQSAYSEFNLLAGGDVAVRSVGVGGVNTYPTRFNFNGGTLRAAASTGSFMAGLTEACIQDGGAILDTAGYTIDIEQPLIGTGGLIKQGAGRLNLQGTNTFTGAIQVNGGDLTLYSSHAGSGSVTCADGTTLGLNSSGTNLMVRLASVTLGGATGGTLRARFGGGQSGYPAEPAAFVTNLTLHGTVAVDVEFSVPGFPADHVIPLIGYETFSGSPTWVLRTVGDGPGTDWVVVNNPGVRQIQLAPATMTCSSDGGVLSFRWPLPGSVLQSNAVNVAHPASWQNVPGTESVTRWIVTPDPAQPNVFYRLRLP